MLRIRDKRVRLILALTLVAVIGVVGYQIGVNFWAMRQYDLARQALERYDYVQATTHLHSYLKMRPNNPSVRILAAQAARRRNDFAEAARQLRLAEQFGASGDDLDLEGQLLGVQQGDLRSADRLVRFCQENPDKPEMPVVLEAVIEGSLIVQDLSRAEASIELFLKHRPGKIDQAQGLVWRGRTNMFLYGVPQAVVDYQEALKLVPHHYVARLWLVEALLLEDPRQAFGHLEWMRTQRPDDLTVRFQQARMHRALGQPEEAGRLLDDMLVTLPDRVPVLIERARVALDLNLPADAERWLMHAESLAPGEREVILVLAACLLRQPGRLDDAHRYQNKLNEIDAKAKSKVKGKK
ncbi:MAG: hypothetical protein EXR98_01575 [Gemmataceae bacterium]|nr:hypothetical protein [Gemmataceae bacterium]